MMNYLEKKKKAMLNYVSGITPTMTTRVTTYSTAGSNPQLEIEIDGVSQIISYSQVRDTLLIFGSVAVLYFEQNWWIVTLGSGTVNGNTTPIATNYHWHYGTSADYEIICNNELNKNTVIFSRGTGSGVIFIADKDDITKQQYNTTPKYNKEIETDYYRGNWHITANQPIKYNGAIYQANDEIVSWNYATQNSWGFEIL